MAETEVVDHGARELARTAQRAIESHEKICVERMTEIRSSISTLRTQLWMLVIGVSSTAILVGLQLLIKTIGSGT